MMTVSKKIMIGLLVAVLIGVPMLTLAQDEDEIDTSDWVEYAPEDGLYSISLPPDWFAGGSPDDPTFLAVVNSEELLETLSSDLSAPAVSGDKAILVFGMFPTDFLALIGLELEEEFTAEDLIAELAVLFAGEESDDEADVEFGEVSVFEIGDEVTVGLIETSSESEAYEGYIYAFEEDGIVVFGLIATYTDEFDEEFTALAYEVLASLEVKVTADELTELMSQ